MSPALYERGLKLKRMGWAPDVRRQHRPGDGGEAPSHDSVDLGESQPGEVGPDDERSRGLAQEDVGRSVQRLTSSCP